MFKGFKQFILRGNALDLATGVVVGGAFSRVVTAFVEDVLNPLIALVAGVPDFSAWTWKVHQSTFRIGNFLNAIASFLLVGAAVYFLVVVPVNRLTASLSRGEGEAVPTHKQCPECLSMIPVAARRCAYCTTVITP